MAYSPLGVPFKLNAADVGAPNYGEAFGNAMKNAQAASETAYKPKNLAEALLSAQLQNKINKPYADNADQMFKADLASRLAATQNIYSLMNERGRSGNQQQMLQQLLSGEAPNGSASNPSQPYGSYDNSDNPGVSAQGPGAVDSTDVRKIFPGRFPPAAAPAGERSWANPQGVPAPQSSLQERVSKGLEQATNKQILNEGNPNLYKVDQIYDQHPGYKALLEKNGFKKTQSVKVDPRTGISSVTTTYPSGRVEVTTTKGSSAGISLTNAVKTQMQNIVAGVPKVSKKIDDLIKAPSPTTVLGYKSNDKAQHNSLVKETAETYAKAKGWPNTNESIKAAIDILDRHTFESDSAYRKRLSDLKKSLSTDLQDARQTLDPNDIARQNNSSHELTYNPATGRLE